MESGSERDDSLGNPIRKGTIRYGIGFRKGRFFREPGSERDDSLENRLEEGQFFRESVRRGTIL
jgi:hypothetical protein